jgi:hypothetical protein
VPRQAALIEPESGIPQADRFLYGYDISKILVSHFQAIYAIYTLYRTRGDQISQFEYRAFGLTVAPYAVNSMPNLLGSLCPEFDEMYMVESSIMEEARRRGGVFEGTVGRLEEDIMPMSPKFTPPDASDLFWWLLEPVSASTGPSGEVLVICESQAEILHITIESTKIPETTVEDGLGLNEGITTGTGKSSDDRIENKRLEKLLRSDEERLLVYLPKDLNPQPHNLLKHPTTLLRNSYWSHP